MGPRRMTEADAAHVGQVSTTVAGQTMQDVRTRWVIVALAAVLALISAVTIVKGRQTQTPVVITGAAPSAQIGPPASVDGGSTPAVVPKSVESAGAPLSATPAEAAQPTEAPAASTTVTVDVAGAVKAPTVYVLPANSRVIDAIKAGGGATADADLDAVNLAEKVTDGEKVYVPRKGETGAAGDVQAGNTIGTGLTASAPAAGAGSDKLIDPSDGQINLNTASVADLQRLPGVGPSMAARIIAFRQQNGGFKSIQDLMNVTGIGQKRMARLAPFVVVR
jgi:competence protein ComEA